MKLRVVAKKVKEERKERQSGVSSNKERERKSIYALISEIITMGRKPRKQVTRQEAFQAIVASAVDGKKPRVSCTPGQTHWRELREYFERNCLVCKRNFSTAEGKVDHMKKRHNKESCCSCHQAVPNSGGGSHENVIPDELLETFYQAIGHQP